MTVKHTNAARCLVCDELLAQVEVLGDDGEFIAPKRVIWCPRCSDWRRVLPAHIDGTVSG